MRNRSLLVGLCFFVMLLSACVPRPLYTEGQNELEETRVQRDEVRRELETLQAQQKQTEEKLQWVEVELGNSETARNQLSQDLNKLQTQTAYLKNIH